MINGVKQMAYCSERRCEAASALGNLAYQPALTKESEAAVQLIMKLAISKFK